MSKKYLKKSLSLIISVVLILNIILLGVFTVSAGQDGNYIYTIVENNGNSCDNTIPSMVIGDPSGDGVVDANDLIYFRKALLSENDSFDNRLDVTKDGKFNLSDLVSFKTHLADNVLDFDYVKGFDNGIQKVVVDNAYPQSQQVEIEINSRNLIPIPYDNSFENTKNNNPYEEVTLNGVHFKPYPDGSIDIWGSCTASTGYCLRNYYHNASDTTRLQLEQGYYAVSVEGENIPQDFSYGSIRLLFVDCFAYPTYPVLGYKPNNDLYGIKLQITTGFQNITKDSPIRLYPKIEKGTENHQFTTGLESLQGITVTLEDGGYDQTATTDSQGKATFTTNGGSDSITVSTDKKLELKVKSYRVQQTGKEASQSDPTVEFKSPTAKAELFSDGDILSLGGSLCKKNKHYTFFGTVDKFDKLIIRHGNQLYNSGWIEIDNTSIKAYSYTTSSRERCNVEHGLTIEGYIGVIINVDDTNTTTVTLLTKSDKYTTQGFYGAPSNGDIEAESVGSSLTNVSFSWTSEDFKKPIWLYGDSYLDFYNSSRWTYHVRTWGFDNWLVEGFPGADAEEVYPYFLQALERGTPKYAIWAQGMNNKDTATEINSVWLYYTELFIKKCQEKGIEPILCTIPNCPNIRHDHKNEYVRNSGYRYIDFAEAVGATQVGSSWYSGMLHQDNVHPTETGAVALAIRAITDVPELMQ